MIGQSFADNLMNELAKLGIDLSSSEPYFLYDIREALSKAESHLTDKGGLQQWLH